MGGWVGEWGGVSETSPTVADALDIHQKYTLGIHQKYTLGTHQKYTLGTPEIYSWYTPEIYHNSNVRTRTQNVRTLKSEPSTHVRARQPKVLYSFAHAVQYTRNHPGARARMCVRACACVRVLARACACVRACARSIADAGAAALAAAVGHWDPGNTPRRWPIARDKSIYAPLGHWNPGRPRSRRERSSLLEPGACWRYGGYSCVVLERSSL